MTIVPTYAALLGIIFFIVSIRIVRLRRSLKIGIGDNNDPIMLRAMRVQSNFAEYVPLCLILLGFAELQGTLPAILHLLSIGLLLGRILHAYGVSQTKENFRFRVSGMALTFTCLLSTCATLIFNFLRNSGI
ncbi:MAPEG family protein [Nodosilinea sp. FACHB-131]|nr:MAPEG family protein [Nodosilinea sp. FACHB-131]